MLDISRSMENRVKELREAAGLTQADLGEAIGVGWQTVSRIENTHTRIMPKREAALSKAFGIPVDELYRQADDAEPYSVDVPVMGYVGAGAEVEPDFEQVPSDGLYQVTIPMKLPPDMIAFQVQGDSMLPQFEDGMVIIVYREQRRAIETFYGQQAVVQTDDGRRFVKTIERGNSGVTLRSWNAKAIENVRLSWVGEIFTFFPAAALQRETRRAARQGGLQGKLHLKTA